LIASDVFGTDTVEILDFMEITETYDFQTIAEDFNGTDFATVGWKLMDSEGS